MTERNGTMIAGTPLPGNAFTAWICEEFQGCAVFLDTKTLPKIPRSLEVPRQFSRSRA
jgi:hypothetical protein